MREQRPESWGKLTAAQVQQLRDILHRRRLTKLKKKGGKEAKDKIGRVDRWELAVTSSDRLCTLLTENAELVHNLQVDEVAMLHQVQALQVMSWTAAPHFAKTVLLQAVGKIEREVTRSSILMMHWLAEATDTSNILRVRGDSIFSETTPPVVVVRPRSLPGLSSSILTSLQHPLPPPTPTRPEPPGFPMAISSSSPTSSPSAAAVEVRLEPML